MDFNDFACGRFIKEFNIPEDKTRQDSIFQIKMKKNELLHTKKL